jgi:hypothetical protein
MSVRTCSALPALVAGLVVLVPSAALAEPRPHDGTATCSELLQQVRYWPGLGHGGRPVFSDAFEVSLLSQPECTDPER